MGYSNPELRSVSRTQHRRILQLGIPSLRSGEAQKWRGDRADFLLKPSDFPIPAPVRLSSEVTYIEECVHKLVSLFVDQKKCGRYDETALQ